MLSPLSPDRGPPLTSVGAIRLRFGWPPDNSSVSPSAVSRLVPVGAVSVPRGVSGGVVIGTPTILPELVAAMLGTCPEIKGGLLSTPVCEAEEVELDRAGDVARGLTKDAVTVGGDGAVRELAESRCLWCEPFGNGEGGANTEVGVGTGVFWLDAAAREDRWGPSSPVYTVPSSPGANDNVEQNPSEDEINNVSPSLDLSSY